MVIACSLYSASALVVGCKQVNKLPRRSRPPQFLWTRFLNSQQYCYDTYVASYSTTSFSQDTSYNSKHNITINLHSTCPYTVLNVPRYSDYGTVKRSFLQAALVYHPDQVETGNAAIFVRIREAFEEILAMSNKNKVSRNDKTTTNNTPQHEWTSESAFQEWLKEEMATATKEFLTFRMDESTRQEVIAVHKEMVRGGNDRGGYWEMARLLAERDEVEQRIRRVGDNPTKQQQQQKSTSGLLSSGIETSEHGTSVSIRRKRNR
jgi:DnaJ domain